eukprot:3587480-Pyramimonas_sp.AAC.1
MADGAELPNQGVLIGALFELREGARRRGLFAPRAVSATVHLAAGSGRQTWFRLWPPQRAGAGVGADEDSEGHESGGEDEAPSLRKCGCQICLDTPARA